MKASRKAAWLVLAALAASLAAQGGAPLVPETGYETQAVIRDGATIGWLAFDRRSLEKLLLQGEKLVVDLALLEGDPRPGRASPPAAAQFPPLVLRFGLYAIQGKAAREIEPSVKAKPLYVWLPLRGDRERLLPPIEVLLRDESGKSDWISVFPFGADPKAPPAVIEVFRPKDLGLRQVDGAPCAVLRFDGWPLGDPLIILPGG
jgi:hypothetical protein